MRLDLVMVIDHLQNTFPSAIWDEELTWIAGQRFTPHELFDYQVLLGHLAARAGKLRIGVGVTDPIRRHPVLIAQAMLTLSHMTRRPPILGIGAGERMNIDPYGLDFTEPAGKLEEALQIIRMCLSSQGLVDFEGKHYRLDGARMDLEAPEGKTPEVWIAGHGPRMLRLTGTYGDGWYPTMVVSPEEYATMLDVVRAAARGAERDPIEITPALHRFVVIGSTEQETRAMLNTRVIRAFGLAAPADLWRKVGHEHPFGEHFRGYVDFVPERYDRRTLEEAIAAVPPEQVASKLAAFGEAGVRHVVFAPVSGLISRRAAIYGLWATRRIARLLADTR
jgi:phthiodiolone/phenolphthiodiolone dimycocerosates ketoreductase